jgi:hypothetical protein
MLIGAAINKCFAAVAIAVIKQPSHNPIRFVSLYCRDTGDSYERRGTLSARGKYASRSFIAFIARRQQISRSPSKLLEQIASAAKRDERIFALRAV